MNHIVKWTAPKTRADGTPLRAGEVSKTAVFVDGVKVAVATGTSFDLSTQAFYKTLQPGTHTVAIAAVDEYGTMSAQTSVGAIVIAPPAAPAAPTGASLS